MPMLYNHIQQAQTRMYDNLDFCRARSSNILKEVARTQVWNFIILEGAEIKK
jgi:hypothetical protein